MMNAEAGTFCIPVRIRSIPVRTCNIPAGMLGIPVRVPSVLP